MKRLIHNIVCCMLVFSYATASFGGQVAVLKRMINPGGGTSTIGTEAGESAPPDTRPCWTLRKYTVPVPTVETAGTLHSQRMPYFDPEAEALPSDCPLFTILISHFPYPPFWPRDPSLLADVPFFVY